MAEANNNKQQKANSATPYRSTDYEKYAEQRNQVRAETNQHIIKRNDGSEVFKKTAEEAAEVYTAKANHKKILKAHYGEKYNKRLLNVVN